jgi:serine O-acetyltransferase
VFARRDDPRASDIRRAVVTQDAFWILVLVRLRERARARRVPGVNHLLRRVLSVVFGCEIGNDVVLGDGVTIIHPVGVVLGGNARLGERVRLLGANTVGTSMEDGYPVIEHDVTLGAGARVLGAVTVGARSIIGANAVVVTDVPPGSLAVGIPARATHEVDGWPDMASTPPSPEGYRVW